MKSAFIIGIFLSMAACSGGGTTGPSSSKPAPPAGALVLAAADYAFSPSTIALKAGKAVTLFISNDGTEDHDLKSAIPLVGLAYGHADNDSSEQADNIAGNKLDVDFASSHYAQVTFTPTTAGSFPFSCGKPGHEHKGMAGSFVVAP